MDDAVKIFEELWQTFSDRYPFFELRNVDWDKQHDIYRPMVTKLTTEDGLFDIFCEMLAPLNDGHVELIAKARGNRKRRYFNPESKPRFWQQFTKQERKQLFETTEKTLVVNGFNRPQETVAWVLHFCRAQSYGYIRILELEGVKKRKLTAALDKIALEFKSLKGIIIDIRDNPGGDDSVVLKIANRFCESKQVAFRRRTKIGQGKDNYTPLKTRYMKPKGGEQFSGPIVLLTCDSVFSGGEVFALAMRQLPQTTIIGDHTNGIFSYQLEKKLSNGWRYCLSYQVYYSADMICYEGKGVPADITALNTKADIEGGCDSLIVRALTVLKSAPPPGNGDP
jgi:carboxyl-terminal processing protease